jgi:hypothetical protein
VHTGKAEPSRETCRSGSNRRPTSGACLAFGLKLSAAVAQRPPRLKAARPVRSRSAPPTTEASEDTDLRVLCISRQEPGNRPRGSREGFVSLAALGQRASPRRV